MMRKERPTLVMPLAHLSALCKYGAFRGVVSRESEASWVFGEASERIFFTFCTALHCSFVCFFFPWVVTSGYTIMLSVL